MSAFSEQELAYLAERRLGRLATVDPDGMPHVVPLGWTYNPAADTIDVGGRDFARTRKFRNVQPTRTWPSSSMTCSHRGGHAPS